MPSIYGIKPAFQNLLRPLVGALASLGVTANQVTIAAVILSLVAGGFIFVWPGAHWPLIVLPVALFMRMVLNAIDGMLAREHNMKTKLGAILNELGDVVSDAVMYLPFGRIAGISFPLIMVIVLLAVISEMTGVVSVQIGGTRRYDGPMGKSDRAFVFGLLAVAMAAGLEPGFWPNAVLGIVALLSVWTIYNRAHRALGEADNDG
ncbi:MAG: CDP-alcohol phosphatidyltransferase family protein [Candidatus Latescibacterota bacterium]|nr:MAG: CDP-alcohol phosphatidyltransferase family protein [Candidatus Latescibacterota bacterium]